MASTKLGELIIELGLESSKFNSGAQGLNRELRTLQAQFKNAGAGIKDFGSSVDGLKAKQEMLSKSIEVQKQKVELYRKQFESSNKTLAENTKKHEELNQKVSAAKSAYEESKEALGENAEETKKLHEEYGKLQKELNQLDSAMKRNVSSLGNTEVNMNRAEASLKEMQAELKETTQELEVQSNKWKKLYKELGEFDGVKEKFSNLGDTLTTRLTAPILAIGAASTKAAMDTETAFMGVAKTTDFAEDEFEQFKEQIFEMSERLPATAVEIAGVAEAAGQLGIEKENLVEFTETMIKLGDTTNLTAEEASSALAKFANITQMPQTQFDQLGATIVELGNNLATTEADIVAMGTRIASAGSQAGMSEAQIMSFAGALSSVGISAEAGGTAFSKFTNELTLAVQTGSGKLSQFASVAGMSAEQFKKAYEQDAAGAIVKFIEGLANAEKQGKSAVQIIEELGIKDSSLRDTLLRAAGASNVFSEALEKGTAAFDKNAALADEARKKYKTLESRLKILKNKFIELGVSIGEALAPQLEKAIDIVENLIDSVKDLDESTINNLVAFGGALATIGPALKRISAGMGAVKTLKELKKLLADTSLLTGLTTLTGLSGGALAGAGLAGGALGLGAGHLLDKNYGKVESFTDTVTNSYDKDPSNDNYAKQKEKMKAWLAEQQQMLSQSYAQFEKNCDDFIKKASDKLQKWIQTQGKNITEFFKNLPQKIDSGLKVVSDNVQEFCLNIVSKISDAFSSILDPVKDTLSRLKDYVSNGLNSAKEAVKNKLSEMVSATQQKFNEMVNKAKEMPRKFKAEAVKMGQGLIDGIKSKANAAKQAVTNTVNNMINSAKAKISSWASIGRSMIEGLINGIKSKVSAAVNAAKSVVTKAYNAAKDFLNINSPSRKFIALGEATTEGLAVGIARTSDRPVQEVRRITQKMQQEMDAFLKKNQSLVNDTNSVLGSITTALSNKYQQMYDKEMNALNQQLSALESWKNASISAAESRRQASIARIDAEIAALERAYREKEQKEQEQDLDDQIKEIRDAMEYEHNEENKKQMEKELDNLLKQKKKMQEKAELERQKEALERQKEAIQAQKEAEIARIQASYDAQKKELEEKMKKLKEFWEKKLKEENLNAEAIKLIQSKNQKEIIKLLKDYLPEYKKRGYNMGEQLVLGMKPKIDELKSMIAGILADINSAKRQANALRAQQARGNKKSIVTNNNNNQKWVDYTINVQGSGNNVRDIDSLMRSVKFSY